MRAFLTFVAAVMTLGGLMGCLYVTFGGIGIYMVASGRATPGEPMFLDELTPSLEDSIFQAGIGIALITAALATRIYVRRYLARMDDSDIGGTRGKRPRLEDE